MLGAVAPIVDPVAAPVLDGVGEGDEANAGIRREPELPEHEEIVANSTPRDEFDFDEGDASEDSARNLKLRERMSSSARQAALDPDDGIEL